ncbi:bacterio-opsin activator domain-containing protein [Natranaeroarchaeum aerophilus]|uniref:Helix-turn-helix domain-containing protein n=1 Tax=Natranaeroarchaeum aerophilus TaxID=2917711 RepID=A0AAE3FLW1_9EURY|nr:bacterio-opsin activator domain-containing protein [Natranaeroarchaeum aerophilus]MCL9812257.1 helix-turn-helix domain-containing protein [Natranaeroarchaeum aerophilus]
MSVLGEFTVPASALAMQQALAKVPEITVEIERIVAHESGTLTPYFWVIGGDMERFKSALEDDPSVMEATRIDILEDETLYRAVWPDNVESVGQAYLEAGATILEASGRNQRWELRLRFDSQGNLSTFHEYCEKNDIPLNVNKIYNPTTAKGGGQFGLTPKQREALVTALDAGFYLVPPDATMTEIAETLGISQQALSKRLRRAHGNIISNVLTIEELVSLE